MQVFCLYLRKLRKKFRNLAWLEIDLQKQPDSKPKAHSAWSWVRNLRFHQILCCVFPRVPVDTFIILSQSRGKVTSIRPCKFLSEYRFVAMKNCSCAQYSDVSQEKAHERTWLTQWKKSPGQSPRKQWRSDTKNAHLTASVAVQLLPSNLLCMLFLSPWRTWCKTKTKSCNLHQTTAYGTTMRGELLTPVVYFCRR